MLVRLRSLPPPPPPAPPSACFLPSALRSPLSTPPPLHQCESLTPCFLSTPSL
ncbi:hypothetical protein PISMIDRAFT_675187 [Pisolithus microcarpus 441]|uniref:Uncharacterized protein n=1 Tax=Pisolithus microcarpus 441 TaxID=765257 RepID=A0A0C9ZYJ9_9AGAM|nr:hypothetical protein PISMIDRAFT_675187 [Pisolithus microcarpus 441]